MMAVTAERLLPGFCPQHVFAGPAHHYGKMPKRDFSGSRLANQRIESLSQLQHRNGKMLVLKFRFKLPAAVEVERNGPNIQLDHAKTSDTEPPPCDFSLSQGK